MAYSAIARFDHESVLAPSAARSDPSDSPPPDLDDDPTTVSLHPPTWNNLIITTQTQTQTQTRGDSNVNLRQLGSTMRSLISSGYELVEEDDYEAPDSERVSPSASHVGQLAADQHQSPVASVLPHSTSPEPLVQTPVGPPIPLRHPTPDLQSLQGAYVGNVERLERSAERLSLKSDIEGEIRKLDLEHKVRSSGSSIVQGLDPPIRRVSNASLSNSIILVNTAARNGGYSPGGYISSPRMSIRSGTASLAGTNLQPIAAASRLAQVTISKRQEEHSDSVNQIHDHIPSLSNPPKPHSSTLHDSREESLRQTSEQAGRQDPPDRPPTAVSTDTYHQATNLFLDFDGVHFAPYLKEPDLTRSLSLNKPPLATRSEPYKEPPKGEKLVYYPAPVPKLLTLPPRLSKNPPISDREKRRTQLIKAISSNDRKSTTDALLVGSSEQAADKQKSKQPSNVPAQLRASVFFDQPSVPLDVEIREQSAVATLDSILDASAHAPVNAFTDHPIVGHLGPEVYGKSHKKAVSKDHAEKKKKQARQSNTGFRLSGAPPVIPEPCFDPGPSQETTERDAAELAVEQTPLRASTYHRDYVDDDHLEKGPNECSSPDDDDDGGEPEEDQDSNKDDGNEEREPAYIGRPTTLLAELQMRKLEQKQRNRTAATAFPNGMHSTLLELDAVAQTQRNARRQKQVTLAWEAPETPDQDADADEDVPLGILFAGKNPVLDERRRPLGLMEKRELEENEPLSQRRARLRGDPLPNPALNHVRRASAMMPATVVGSTASDSGEEETLAQRLQRLKDKDQSTPAVGNNDFANELMAEITTKFGVDTPEGAISKPAEEEETLAQRRERLQAGKAQGDATPEATPKPQRSMANILHAYPASAPQKPVVDNVAAKVPLKEHANRLSTAYTLTQSVTHPTTGYPPHASTGMRAAYGGGVTYGNPFVYNRNSIGMNDFAYGMPHVQDTPVAPANIDARQRDMIDRWRQSVVR